MNELQVKTLELLKQFDRLCRENDVTFSSRIELSISVTILRRVFCCFTASII